MGTFANVTSRILSARMLSADDVLALRQSFYADSKISIAEADDIFAINTQIIQKPQEWYDFFIGAITDFLIRQTPPIGYIDEATALWLIQRIDYDGVVELITEYELLMHILYYAVDVPERLKEYALNQVKLCVLTREGALINGQTLTAGRVDAYDVECLRRIFYACSGEGGTGISAQEAEILFELDELTQNADNHPSWKEFFVKANLNFLMTMGMPKAVSRERMLQNQEWLNSSGGGVIFGRPKSDKSFGENFMDGLSEMFGRQKESDNYKSYLDDPIARDRAEAVDLSEASWLIGRINRDGFMSDNERALLKILEIECPDIHESLLPLIKAA